MFSLTNNHQIIGKSRFFGKKLILFLILLLLLFFLTSCQQQKSPEELNTVLEKYLSCWNGESLATLDAVTSESFQLRINPNFQPVNGRDKLKEAISKTRFAYPDFSIEVKEKIILGDTALALTWRMSGTNKNPQDTATYGKQTEAQGFSIVFFNKETITGEWIAYSDLTWKKNLGYELVLPKKEERTKK